MCVCALANVCVGSFECFSPFFRAAVSTYEDMKWWAVFFVSSSSRHILSNTRTSIACANRVLQLLDTTERGSDLAANSIRKNLVSLSFCEYWRFIFAFLHAIGFFVKIN